MASLSSLGASIQSQLRCSVYFAWPEATRRVFCRHRVILTRVIPASNNPIGLYLAEQLLHWLYLQWDERWGTYTACKGPYCWQPHLSICSPYPSTILEQAGNAGHGFVLLSFVWLCWGCWSPIYKGEIPAEITLPSMHLCLPRFKGRDPAH